ncbi:MAG: hypothetical protein M1833_001736 [Piccolia ochrophora]|nr:MAG: hypothetical protein M1833_001736 [Piccolia ochrophora]
MPQYRVELSPNNRAGCKNKLCKDQGVKILKGEIRFATWVEIAERGGSWQYRHWGCVTPKQLDHLKGAIEGNFELFDGYDELPANEQAKMRRVLEQGHVDDEDWKWDVEYNRPGMTGFQKRTPKKKNVDVEDTTIEAEASPVRKTTKKRERTKSGLEDAQELAPKKVKSGSNKARKSSEVDEAEVNVSGKAEQAYEEVVPKRGAPKKTKATTASKELSAEKPTSVNKVSSKERAAARKKGTDKAESSANRKTSAKETSSANSEPPTKVKESKTGEDTSGVEGGAEADLFDHKASTSKKTSKATKKAKPISGGIEADDESSMISKDAKVPASKAGKRVAKHSKEFEVKDTGEGSPMRRSSRTKRT